MTEYTTILALCISIPLILSFEQKLKFYQRWPKLFPSLILVSVLFIVPDIVFTRKGHWGFNHQYHSVVVFGLPIEEWLFFVVVPYASLFLHYTFEAYFPFLKANKTITKIAFYLLTTIGLIGLILYRNKAYTFYVSGITLLSLTLAYFFNLRSLQRFLFTYIIILIPFTIVNGILTGSFIDKTIVWYNHQAILGVRILTIPIEDFFYAFSLILFNLFIFEITSRTVKHENHAI